MGWSLPWVLIAVGLVVVLLAPRLRRPVAKPCLLCDAPGTHRMPRRKLTFGPMPALCCRHRYAFAARRREVRCGD
jgi:hypothetical protein